MPATNNKANVSTTRGLVGGYFFSAPIGTTDLPTKETFATWAPGDSWENQGYIPEDGFTENLSSDGNDDIRDINLEAVCTTDGSITESVQVDFMENAYAPLATRFGHANVTDANGTIEVDHNWAQADEERMYAFILILKGDRRWVKFIPRGKVTERSERTVNKTTVNIGSVTITYLTDDNGSGCFDWIQSNDTPAPALTALSGTNITLSPTFDASVRAYTATTSSSSSTITATAASGNTVAIKDGNGNAYSSGGSVPLVAGKNVLTVTVTHTDSGSKGTYTVTITKS